MPAFPPLRGAPFRFCFPALGFAPLPFGPWKLEGGEARFAFGTSGAVFFDFKQMGSSLLLFPVIGLSFRCFRCFRG